MQQTSRPQTPAENAAALRVLANQLDTLDPGLRLRVGVNIQPASHEDTATVDKVAVALFGCAAVDSHVVDDKWHRTTSLSGLHHHVTGLNVNTYAAIPAPSPEAEQVAAALLTPDAEPGKVWACPEGCGYHIVDGPVPDGEPPTWELIREHLAEHEHADDRPTYRSPVPIADIETEIDRLNPSTVDAEDLPRLLAAQRDLWETHARIAHTRLDELRAAVEQMLADVGTKPSPDDDWSTVPFKAVDALRAALGGVS